MRSTGTRPGFGTKPPRLGSRSALTLGIAVSVLLGIALLAGPAVRALARSRAAAAGFQIQIDEVRLGAGAVVLRGVHLESAELTGIRASLANVVIVPGLGSARRFEVHGGAILARGSREELERQWQSFRASHARGGEKSGPSTLLSVDGIDARWDRSGEHQPPVDVWGARYARTEDGSETLGEDLARASMPGASLEVAAARVGLGREAGRRVIRTVQTGRLDAVLELDEPARGGASSGPGLQSSGAPKTTTAVVEADDPGPRLRQRLDRLGDSLGSWLASAQNLEITGVHVEVRHEGQSLNIGPAVVKAVRDSAGVHLSMTSGAAEASAPLRLDVTLPPAASPIEIGLVGGPLSLGALGVEEHDMGLEDVGRAEVEVNGKATLSGDGRTLDVAGRSRLSDLSIYHPKLANDPVHGIRVGLSGRSEIRLDGSGARFDDLELEVGKVKAHARGAIERAGGHAKGQLHLDVPLAACGDMLASVPAALDPLLSGLEVKGTFAFSGDLDFDTRKPGDTRVDWDAANECKISSVPAALSPERFSHPWTRTVLGAGAVPMSLESGPGTRDWTAFADISPYMATAVVVCEDASFFVHGGFNEKSIRDSIRDNLRAGKFLRGASTVTMQLAKNLYLAREKTLSRKLQEAVLTLLLEQSLTKEQILELYLNVIEFAPGVYGIGPAADHYFHTVPKDLSLGQAFYLISILPNPKIHHFAADGTLSSGWTEYLRHLMQIAFKIRRIDERDLASGLGETLKFGEPSASGAAGPAPAAGDVGDVGDVGPPREGEGEEGP